MTFEQIKELTCKHFKVTKSQVEGKGRKTDVVYARIAIAMMLFKRGYKVVEIASMLSINHSTVIHYLKTFDDRMKYDIIFANTYKDFKEECN